MIFEQVEDRASSGTDGVGVANACLSIFIDDGDNRGFLGDEGLNGISTLDLRIQIDQLELLYRYIELTDHYNHKILKILVLTPLFLHSKNI